MIFKLIYNKIFRKPMSECVKIFEEYNKLPDKNKTFAEQQQIMDSLSHKTFSRKMIKDEVFKEAAISLMFCLKNRSKLTDKFYEELKKYPMIIWIELMEIIEDKDRLLFLKNYHKELPQMILETFIINLSDSLQVETIEKYKNYIKPSKETYENFYYSVCSEARKKLDRLYPKNRDIDIIEELKDLEEKDLYDAVYKNKNKIGHKLLEEYIEMILEKTTSLDTIINTLKIFNDKLDNISNELFELLITRIKYLQKDYCKNRYYVWDVEDEIEESEYDDLNIYTLFKERFLKLGLEKTLDLMDLKTGYSANETTVNIVLDFINTNCANLNEEILDTYINKETIIEVIKKYKEKCEEKTYQVEDFIKLVDSIDINKNNKVVKYDLIEAIIACSKLMNNNVIDNKNEYYLKLKEKFELTLFNNLEKDGSLNNIINLNGILYRLIKGSLNYEEVFSTNTLKGLIYLAKSGATTLDADEITKLLTDEQLLKMNISPLLRWKKEYINNNPNKSTSFMERIGLQLLCYFGELKAKHILDSGMKKNRMENLFDELNYKDIEIDEQGNSIKNNELINFLFGRGKVREENSCMNRLIREEIKDFGKYFTDFCNNYYKIKDECKNLLSVKRIVNYYEKSELPIELKPNQYNYVSALRELNTTEPDILNKAIDLIDKSKEREYSTIPKVEGKVGDFEYKVLDLKDPLNVAVGYLSHCCFTINRMSSSALNHAMTSNNGRIFIVYYKGKFLTQSWIWRNGDVICFDSVEAGSHYHDAYEDNIKLVDVYKKAAEDMMKISHQKEDEIQRVKTITVGKSDFRFDGLEPIKNKVPKPLENNLYVYDSAMQWILSGKELEEPRYGAVAAKYYDKRDKVINIKDIKNSNIDDLTETINKIVSIKYTKNNDESFDIEKYKQLIVGEDWYILVEKNNNIEVEILNNKEETIEECKKYSLALNNIISPTKLSNLSKDEFIKKLLLINNK